MEKPRQTKPILSSSDKKTQKIVAKQTKPLLEWADPSLLEKDQSGNPVRPKDTTGKLYWTVEVAKEANEAKKSKRLSSKAKKVGMSATIAAAKQSYLDQDGGIRSRFGSWMRDFFGFAEQAKINPDIPMIEVKNYTKKFGKFVANKDVSFNVGHGVIHGFIGPNGSGKTTTMKTLIGAYTLQEGTMLINGHKPSSIKAKTLLGYIPERASFPAHLNCIDYLAEMGAMSGIAYKKAKKIAYGILKELGMSDHAKRKPISFSSGMQKKILLAQALLNDPPLLILDEPAANLDPTARKELLDELIRLRDSGKTIFISSHILSELERFINEVTFLFYGQVLFTGRIEDAELKTQRAFFRTNDNKRAASVLRAAGYRVQGDEQTEQFVECKDAAEAEAVLAKLASVPDIQVKLFKTNDLQTIYEVMLAEAVARDKGLQTLGEKRVRAENYRV